LLTTGNDPRAEAMSGCWNIGRRQSAMDDRRIETHPDLMDPDWQKHAEREAWTEVRRSRRRSKRGRARLPGLWVVVALLVLISAAVTVKQLGGISANDGLGASSAPKTPPTTAPSVLPQVAAVDLTQPFSNTPAALWKDGAAGFSTPAASAIGTFSAVQIKDAYDKVIHAVAAGRLDRKTVEGHDTTAFLASFAPNDAKFIKTKLDQPDKSGAASYVTLIADGFHLLPAGPRLNGRLSATSGTEPGELVIHAEYVIAYAFDTAHAEQLTSPGDIVAFMRQDENYLIHTGSRYYKADQGLGFGDGKGEWLSVACAPYKAGYLAPSYSDHTAHPPSTKDETAMYDLDKPLPLEDTCGP
jgi:hypothetical protein